MKTVGHTVFWITRCFGSPTVALIKFASRSLLTKLHLKKKSGGRKTRR
jgi:hypothetical protein